MSEVKTKAEAQKSMIGTFINQTTGVATNNFLPLLSFEIYETDESNVYLVIDKVKFEDKGQQDFFLDVVNDPTIRGAGRTVSLGYYGVRVEMLNAVVSSIRNKPALKCYSSDFKLIALVRQT